jgi:hypothetical protein
MHFTLLIFLFLLGAVLWGFFHSNPKGVSNGALLACNVLILAAAAVAAIAAGTMLYADAVLVQEHQKGLATYLSIMAGGTAFLILVAGGGMVRNLLIFPMSRRASPSPRA